MIQLNMFKTQRARVLALAAAVLIGVSAQARGNENERRPVDLSPQALGNALVQLSSLYDVSILADEDQVRGQRSPAVTGTLTLREALRAALADSTLEIRRTGSGVFVVAPKTPRDRAPRPRRVDAQNAAPVEEIIVRGQKFERTLMDTVTSVAVLPGSVVDESYLTDLTQILQRTVNVADAGFGPIIRGIPERGVGSGTGDTSQTSAVYVDGAIQSQFGGSAGLTSTWDLEQVEVFRGAQTTTQGRAALGGAIVVNTVDPDFDWSGRARVAAGEFGTQQYAAAIGGPLAGETLAFRISGDLLRTDGFTDFQTVDGATIDDIGQSDRDLLRAKLLFRPSERTDVLLTLTRGESTEAPNTVNGPDFFARRASEVINVNETDVTSFVLEATHDLTDSLSLTSVTSVTDLSLTTRPVEATLGGQGVSTVLNAEDDTVTQELRLNYNNGGAVSAIGGVYYNDFKESSQRTLTGTLFGADFFRSDGYDNDFRNFAVFGEAQLAVTDRLALTVGARYDVEDSSRDENATTRLDPPLAFIPNVSTEFAGDAEFNAFLPKLGLTYSLNDNASVSATYQQAYRPGGADIRPDTNAAIEFDPEYTDNYELAFRGTWLDGTLTFGANLYLIDYTDMQIRFAPDPAVPINRFIDNAGEAELYGLEIETQWKATESLSLYGSVGFAESELGEFLFQGANLEGNEFPNQPGINASFGGTLRLDSGLRLTIDALYSDDFLSGVQNDPGQRVHSYFVTNIRLGYEAAHWSAYVYGRNLFDEDYLLSVAGDTPGSTFSTATLGQPQAFGVVLETRF
ncbi:MAG: TonB-dependent receptor [Pseudomonadota bacterium]